jgi:hypothetical protein
VSDDMFEPPPVAPAIEADTGLSPVEVRLCPGCGKPESQWKASGGRGFSADDGYTYCCDGCALQTGCTCV